MQRKVLLAAKLIATLAIACDARGGAPDLPQTTEARARRPNVILYVADTLRADGLGCYGNRRVDTPAVDALAREGVLFRNAYAHSSWTRPSIASILTGLYPDTHGVETRESVVGEQLELLPEIFAGHGYATAAIITNPNVGSFFGFGQGFDVFEELYLRRDTGLVMPSELVARADLVGNRVLEWIADARQPFFLFVLTIDPHWPYTPPKRFDRYGGAYRGPLDEAGGVTRAVELPPADRRRIRSFYDGEVAFNDAALSRIVSRLRAQGLYDETIVLFTSDHGEEFWDHEGRFHSKTLFEEIIRIPMVIRYPRAIRAGLEVKAPVESVGILPTLLKLAELPVPAGVDGRDLLDRSTDLGATAYATVNMGGTNLRSLIRRPWKMIFDPDSGDRLLFNLEVDPRERSGLDGSQYPVGESLHAALESRLQANAERRASLYDGRTPERISEASLPEASRAALEQLGYIEADGSTERAE